MTAPRAYCLFVVAAGLASACYPEAVDPYGNKYTFLKPGTFSGTSPTPTDGVTWHKDVRALVEKNCVRCHSAEGVGPFSLETFEATDGWRETMVLNVESGRMPFYGIDEECNALAAPRTIPEADKQVFRDWQAEGFLPGDERDYVAPEAPADFVGQGEVEVPMTREPYAPAADETRCFLLSQEVTSPPTSDPRGWWVTDVRVDVDVRDIVQQATIYVIAPEENAAVPSDPRGFACDLGAGTANEVGLYAWVPGKAPLSFAQETALLVRTGSRFVLKLRYRVEDEEPIPADATGVTLWRYLGKRTPSESQVGLHAMNASGAAPVEAYLPRSEKIFGVVPEMSEGGETFALDYVVGIPTCLAASDNWDFRFSSETLSFADGDYTNAFLGYETHLACTHADGTATPRCRATLMGTFPLHDSPYTLGRTCSGVDQCLLSCNSNTSTCLLDCLAWELPECGECAKAQLFETCAPLVDGTKATSMIGCETASCADADAFPDWLSCMLEHCKEPLTIMQDAIEDELPSGICNALNDQCVYFPVAPP